MPEVGAPELGIGGGLIALGSVLTAFGKRAIPVVLSSLKNGSGGNFGRSRGNSNGRISEAEWRGKMLELTETMADNLQEMRKESSEFRKEEACNHMKTHTILDSINNNRR